MFHSAGTNCREGRMRSAAVVDLRSGPATGSNQSCFAFGTDRLQTPHSVCLTSSTRVNTDRQRLASPSRRRRLTARSKTPGGVVTAVCDRRNRARMRSFFGAHRAPLEFLNGLLTCLSHRRAAFTRHQPRHADRRGIHQVVWARRSLKRRERRAPGAWRRCNLTAGIAS